MQTNNTNRYYEGSIVGIHSGLLLTINYNLGFGITMSMDTRLIDPSTGEPLHGKEPLYGSSLNKFISEWHINNMKVFINVMRHDRQYAYGVIYPYSNSENDLMSINTLLINSGYTIQETDKSASRALKSSDENTKVTPLTIVNPYDEETNTWWQPRKSF